MCTVFLLLLAHAGRYSCLAPVSTPEPLRILARPLQGHLGALSPTALSSDRHRGREAAHRGSQGPPSPPWMRHLTTGISTETILKTDVQGAVCPQCWESSHLQEKFLGVKGSQHPAILKSNPRHLGNYEIIIIGRSNLLKQ